MSVWDNFSSKLILKGKLRMQKRGVFHHKIQTRHGARFPFSLAFELLMSLRRQSLKLGLLVFMRLFVLTMKAYNYYTILYYTILYTILYYTILYCTVLYCTVLYCTVLYCTVLYYTILFYWVKFLWVKCSSKFPETEKCTNLPIKLVYMHCFHSNNVVSSICNAN